MCLSESECINGRGLKNIEERKPFFFLAYFRR